MGSSTNEWLSLLKEDLFSITTEAALEHWPGPTPPDPPYYNYRLEHILQVERDAKRLLEFVGGDEDIIFASVWIHDRFQPQYIDTDHPKEAAIWARTHLSTLGFPSNKVESVCYCVGNHSNLPGTIPHKKHEARLLWDADKLSKVGATSIVALILASPAFSHKATGFQQIALSELQNLNPLNDFTDQFYFDVSKKMAKERFLVQKNFIEGFADEVGIHL